MRMNRGRVVFLMAAAGLYLGWQYLSPNAYETATLRIPPSVRSQDTYVRLWVVDDAHGLWIRAASPDRLWLAYLRDDPVVELERGGQTLKYRAQRDDRPATRAYVDARFRAKYGLVDELRGLFWRETVPIRLVRP